MRTRLRPLVAKLGVIAILLGSVFGTTAAFHLESDMWIALSSLAAVIVGVVLVNHACHGVLYRWVLIERVVLICMFGALIPVAGMLMFSVAWAHSGLWRATVVVALGAAVVWIARRVPINIDSWFDGASSVLDRTRGK